MIDRKIRLMIIEDDKDYFDIVKLCLEEPDAMGMEFELDWADRLETGLQRLAAAPWDALLLDLMLPDSRGLETFIKVLATGLQAPVLITTNQGDEAMAFEAMRLGAQDYMVKATSDSRMLKRAIWYAMERRKLLAQSENIIKGTSDAMLVMDASGTILFANPAAEALMGSETALGQAFPYPATPGEAHLLRVQAPSGEERSLEMRTTEILWNEITARLACLRDITELQKLEQLKAEVRERRKIDRLKDEFIGTVSHELRTPLTILQGAIDSLTEELAGPLTPKQKEMVAMACRHLNRLAKMINNLLDLSRLESGQAKVQRRRLNPAPLIEEAAEGLRLASRDRNIAMELEISGDLPEVYADPDMIGQVLGNLLDNALRFARTRLVLRATRTDSGPGALVEVLDDGPGVPPERIGELFNKFVQVNRVLGVAGYKGTGLGLAICKEILALHGSSIGVESAPGSMTRFHFVLPAYSQAAASAPQGSA